MSRDQGFPISKKDSKNAKNAKNARKEKLYLEKSKIESSFFNDYVLLQVRGNT